MRPPCPRARRRPRHVRRTCGKDSLARQRQILPMESLHAQTRELEAKHGTQRQPQQKDNPCRKTQVIPSQAAIRTKCRPLIYRTGCLPQSGGMLREFGMARAARQKLLDNNMSVGVPPLPGLGNKLEQDFALRERIELAGQHCRRCQGFFILLRHKVR